MLADETIVEPRLPAAGEPNAGRRLERFAEGVVVGVVRIVGVKKLKTGRPPFAHERWPRAIARADRGVERFVARVFFAPKTGAWHKDNSSVFAPGEFHEPVKHIV